MGRRVLVLGLDGLPHDFLVRQAREGRMPNAAAILAEGSLRQMDSVYPTVSGVAWASFQTGQDPGRFGVYGFAQVDRGLDVWIPDSRHLRGETLWEYLDRRGLRVVSLGVPMSYPPRPLQNGILVGCFLSPDLERAVHPPSARAALEECGYVIDADPILARRDLGAFRGALRVAFSGRSRTLFRMMDAERWDLLVMHVMDTDRLHHFFWRWAEEPDSANGAFFQAFYQELDRVLGQVRDRLGEDTTLVLASDHGFCGIRAEVQLNAWLVAQGYLGVRGDPAGGFRTLAPGSRAFGLVPGRVHLLRRGVYDGGTLDERDAASLRDEIAGRLREWRDPDTGQPVCRRVMTREEAFLGATGDGAPDLVIDPEDGYDFKASLGTRAQYTHSALVGMHTYRDALVYVGGRALVDRRPVIYDCMPTILELLEVEVPAGLDGRSLLA